MAIARARVHEGLIDIVVPGVLKDFDLPDLAAAIGPRPVWIVEPRTPSGARARREEAAEWKPARVLYRPEGWAFDKVYAGF